MTAPHGSDQRATPAVLRMACFVALLEAAAIASVGVVELVSLTSARLTMGLTTSAFFLGYAAALAWSAWSLARLRYWARSPVVLAQFIQLGVAWSFHGGSTTWIAIVLAAMAVVVLFGVFSPSSLAVIAETED